VIKKALNCYAQATALHRGRHVHARNAWEMTLIAFKVLE
jgi:hypothetical protein